MQLFSNGKINSKEKHDFKILLNLDSALTHKVDYESLSSKVSAVFLPPNTMLNLRQLDQGGIVTSEAHYLQRAFSKPVKNAG
jgi:hypothetical protein